MSDQILRRFDRHNEVTLFTCSDILLLQREWQTGGAKPQTGCNCTYALLQRT